MNAFTKHNPPALLLKDAMVATFGVGGGAIPPGAVIPPVVLPAGRGPPVVAANAGPATIVQVQPAMMPGRPSAAFDFTALGLMAKIIGTVRPFV